jgi:hypothetical protein
MRYSSILSGAALCAALIAFSGCKKEEPAPPQVPKADAGGTPQTAPSIDAAKSAAKGAADQAMDQTKALEQQAQGIIDRAKALISEQNYPEALDNLAKVASFKLTPEQKKSVDDLKSQIHSDLMKLAGTNAAFVPGGAPDGKQ